MTAVAQQADAHGIERILATDPAWTGIVRAADVLPRRRTLLHAGPLFREWRTVPVPVRNSLALAAVYEGWATTPEEASDALASGDIAYAPAQDHGMVVPLCGVISPSMALHVVTDGASGRVRYAALNEGMDHCLRLGRLDGEIPEFHRWLNDAYATYLRERLDEPVRLLPLIAQSQAAGDDGHSRTLAGSGLLRDRLVDAHTPQDVAEFLGGCGAFALNLWMGAAALMLSAAEGIADCGLVTRAGGNGVEFGIQIAARPGQWTTTPAAPPQGTVDSGVIGDDVLGAIGDSAVVDVLGLGGQSLCHAPTVREAVRDHLPADALTRPGRLLPGTLDPAGGLRTGLSARTVTEAGAGPLVLLGMMSLSGRGRLGGGVYEPPIELFAAAL